MSSPHLVRCWIALLVGLSACGYRTLSAPLRADGAPLRIEVSMFENRTSEPGFEAVLAEALTEELLRRGQKPLYDDKAGTADFSLSGVIRTARADPSSFSSVGLVLEFELVVGLRVYLRRNDGELVWTHDELRDRELFPASADPGVERSNREQALRRIAAELAGRINDELAQSL